MYFFKESDVEKLVDSIKDKLIIADRLIEDIDKSLEDSSKNNLRSIKSAIFDIVVLSKVMNRLGINAKLKGDLKRIRDSLAHVDERIESFDYLPAEINGLEYTREVSGDKFKHSLSMNFQGAVLSAMPGIPVEEGHKADIKIISPFGMFNDYFLWIDKSGVQRYTKVEDIKSMFSEFLQDLKIGLK